MGEALAERGYTTAGTYFEYRDGPGPLLVLVHGLGLNLDMWRWQHAAITARYQLLTYDLLGSGRSHPPPAKPTLAMFSQQLFELLNELQIDKVALAGFSLGGMIVRRFTMDHPQWVSALAILHSAYKRDKAAHSAIQQRVYQARDAGPQATVEAALERWFTDSFRQSNPQIMAFIRESILANDKAIYPQLYQVLVDGVDELVNPNPAITCPTLVLTAEQDYGNSVEMCYAIAAEIAQARTVILPGLRHMAMIEAPELFNRELVDFFSSCNLVNV